MQPLEGDEEVKEGKGLRILTQNKLLTRLPILLTQIKAGDNSDKLKTKLDKYYIFYISKITKKVSNNLIKSLQSCKKIWCWWEFETWNWIYHKKQ